MPTLYIRELPENIYNELVDLAKREHRSITQQTIEILEKGLKIPKDRHEHKQRIISRTKKIANQIKKYNLTDPSKLIREERDK